MNNFDQEIKEYQERTIKQVRAREVVVYWLRRNIGKDRFEDYDDGVNMCYGAMVEESVKILREYFNKFGKWPPHDEMESVYQYLSSALYREDNLEWEAAEWAERSEYRWVKLWFKETYPELHEWCQNNLDCTNFVYEYHNGRNTKAKDLLSFYSKGQGNTDEILFLTYVADKPAMHFEKKF